MLYRWNTISGAAVPGLFQACFSDAAHNKPELCYTHG